MRRYRSSRVLLVVLTGGAALVTAACGARLSSSQHAAGVALETGTGHGTTGSGGAPSSAAAPVGPTDSGAVPAPAGPAGTGVAAPVTGPTGGAGAPAVTTTTAPPTGGGGTRSAAVTGAPKSGAPSSPAAAGDGCPAGTLGASDTGVTASTIRIANSADITGPVPGLFQTAQDGAKAFLAYFNGTNQTVCGRKLTLDTLDSQTSDAGDHDAVTKACSSDFALVGSISAYDDGGASAAQTCGIPDLRSATTTSARQAVPNTFGAESTSERNYPSTTPDYFKTKFGDALTQHAAFLYINVGVGQEQGKYTSQAWMADGYHYDYVAGIDISDFNYAPFVQTMKSKGIQSVQFVGAESQAANLVKTIVAQGFKPDAIILQANVYDAVYPTAAGAAATGTYTYIPGQLFTEAGSNAETQLYVQWLARVAPNEAPSFFGEFAWSAMRLFVTQARRIGPDLTRKAMISSLSGVHGWTANGMHAPQDVGGHNSGNCESVIQWNGSAWVRLTPAPWECGRLLPSGKS
jgi:hypothetical protein